MSDDQAAPKARDAGGSPPAQPRQEERAPADLNPEAAAVAAEHEASEQAAEQVAAELDELGEARKQRDEYLELAQRTRADFDNYRKRVSKEAADATERGKHELAKQLIPVLDDLERAIAAGDSDSDPAALAKGVALVHEELRSTLGGVGLEPYDPTGERFDPSWHEAVSTRAQEGVAAGIVVETIVPGYRLDGQALRAARVVVSE